jgi:hypothetical protein
MNVKQDDVNICTKHIGVNIGIKGDDVTMDTKQIDVYTNTKPIKHGNVIMCVKHKYVGMNVPFKVWMVTRGNGDNAIEYASYLYGKGIRDEATGKLVNRAGRRAKRIKYTVTLAPFKAHKFARHITTLANAVEQYEPRKDSTLFREIRLPLPYQLTRTEHIRLVRRFARSEFVNDGYAVFISYHIPEPELGGDKRNYHAHLLITLRMVDETGFMFTELKDCHRDVRKLLQWRSKWEELVNSAFEKHLTMERSTA